MGQVERQGHVVVGLVRGVTEHHTLVAGTLLLLRSTAHAHIDIGRLRMQGRQYAATLGLKLILGLGVSDLADRVARDLLHVYVVLAGDLTRYHNLTRRTHRLAGHVRILVQRKNIVQNRIRYLVTHFVRVSFRHRF